MANIIVTVKKVTFLDQLHVEYMATCTKCAKTSQGVMNMQKIRNLHVGCSLCKLTAMFDVEKLIMDTARGWNISSYDLNQIKEFLETYKT